GPCRGGEQARRLRWAAPFWQAVAPPATRRDDPDSLYGTLVWHLAWAGRAPAASHSVSVLEPRSPPREGLAHGQPLQLCDAAQEPASRSHIAYPSDGPRADRPCLELWRVYLAAGAHRSSPQQADGRTGHMFADSSSSGPIFGKNPSTYSRRDARRARKRGGPSAESCVRCLLLFSRTTRTTYRAAIRILDRRWTTGFIEVFSSLRCFFPLPHIVPCSSH